MLAMIQYLSCCNNDVTMVLMLKAIIFTVP